MRIDHVALWTERLEELRDFYVGNFGGRSNEKYVNPAKGFESYFIAFGDGCRLELMRRTDIRERAQQPQPGFCHLAFGCAGRSEVLALTERLRSEGHRIVGEPRTTGDGCFESVVADPDGNLIEIVA
ncbi:VOC family protein [uncultured Alistipes sp.]|uniref:VOC family protein n=1 Tax=uncultured Alistipes sp. TaxID=538949 RepID=UPI00272A94D0|nr:VOC family protein [uncultured Alistipes sp.]